tara:strand:- start:135 stop:1325 length:1191 start_codon:yes stop_codon:yes gene_type:complete
MSKKIGFLELIGGASGDMLIGSLIDAGLSKEDLLRELMLIDLPKWEIKVQKVKRCAVKATLIDFFQEKKYKRKYDWNTFKNIINDSKLPTNDKERITDIFNILMSAETKVHEVSSGNLHLHELGTIDTILDIAGFVIGLRLLGINDLYCSSLPISVGVIENSHGVMTSNSLATVEIYKSYNLPIKTSDLMPDKEMVTPTGAAILSSLCKFKKVDFNISNISYGAGNNDPENYPNVLGFWTGEKKYTSHGDVILIETNIDDSTGEILGYTMEKLFESKAIDVWFSYIQMKKNRPGIKLSVLAESVDLDEISRIIFMETSTLGLRYKSMNRIKADREVHEIQTNLGNARVKIKKINGKIIHFSPEYESCRAIAREKNISLNDVISMVIEESKNQLLSD